VARSEPERTEEYRPGTRFTTVFWILVILVVSAGILVTANTDYREDMGYSYWIWFAATLAGAIVGPLLVQYMALRRSGVRLRRKPWTASNRVPYLARWWNPEGRGLTKRQFVAAMGAPALVFWVILISYAIGNPNSAGAISFGLITVMGNFWYSALVLSKARGTLIEEFEGGLRFHLPTGRRVLNSHRRGVQEGTWNASR
jgi:hypothetical protein